MITKEQIDRYLKNECNEDERRLVADYLAEHPEIVGHYLTEEEFAAQQPEPWEKERSERALQSIREQLFRRPAVVRRLKAGLAAASVILIIGLVWFFSRGKSTSPGQNPATSTTPLADVLEHRANNTNSTVTIILIDGSTVDLGPNSEVAYKKTFSSDPERKIQLKGQALFSVAKDKTRPFIVMSGDLTTTVLGTSFSIDADPREQIIKVHLFTGKVAVSMKRKSDSAIGLLPGDELVYDRQLMTARVNTSAKKNMAVSTGRKGGKALQPDWYMFGGQSLPQVFDQLSEYYGVEINYYPADVSNRYFTGKFSRTDSLETILKDISLLNDLSLKKTDGAYIFRKKKH